MIQPSPPPGLTRGNQLGSSLGSDWRMCYLGCVFQVIVMFEGKHLPHSEVLGALEQDFLNNVSGI